ncbi:MAG: 50S ribosomal protein L4 [Candidatus Bathyarchaeota archaeon]|nr:50S ribosomal protein L4 [Candidatus Bathyarchaeota archaeon]
MSRTKKTLTIFSLEGKPEGKTTLPKIFATSIRPDVIKRAVLAIQSTRIQPQGRDPMAGKKTSAESRGTGLGISRIPRVKGGGGKAGFAPSTVGGRQPHPPKSEKKIIKNIPKKEARFALYSAVAATASKQNVVFRGHQIESVPQIPLIITDAIEGLSKTSEVEATLISLGLVSELDRAKNSRKIRAGKGKRRGRKMKQAVGPLIVVAKNKGISKAASNIPGVDVIEVNNLNTEMLAPGTTPGRLTLWSIGALTKLNKNNTGGQD